MNKVNELNIDILCHAKTEYTKQLTNILTPHIYEGLCNIFNDAFTNNNDNYLAEFQILLRNVPKWNQDIIDTECQRIITKTNCDWLDDLITAVFVSNTKILTAIRLVNTDAKINLTIPKIDHFIHKSYIEVAREIYKNPYLFDINVQNIEKQRNMREALSIITQSIIEAIRKSLPVQQILNHYLGKASALNNNDDDDISQYSSNDYINTIKDYAKQEIQSSVKYLDNDNTKYNNIEIEKPIFNPIKDSSLHITTHENILNKSINEIDEIVNNTNDSISSIDSNFSQQDFNVENTVEDNVENTVEDNVEDNVENIVEDNVENIVEDNVEDNVKDNVENIVEDNVEDNVKDNVEDNVEDNVKDNVEDNVKDNIEDNVEDNIKENIEDNINSIIKNDIEINFKKTEDKRSKQEIINDYTPKTLKTPIQLQLDELQKQQNNLIKQQQLLQQQLLQEQQIEQPVQQQIEQLIQQHQPVEQSVEQPVEQSVEQPVEQSVEQPVEQYVEQSVEQPVEQYVEQSVEQPVEQYVEQSVEQYVEQPVEQPVEQYVEQSVEQYVEQPVEQPVKQSVEQLEQLYVSSGSPVSYNINGNIENSESNTGSVVPLQLIAPLRSVESDNNINRRDNSNKIKSQYINNFMTGMLKKSNISDTDMIGHIGNKKIKNIIIKTNHGNKKKTLNGIPDSKFNFFDDALN
jgi:hypothetical protein